MKNTQLVKAAYLVVHLQVYSGTFFSQNHVRNTEQWHSSHFNSVHLKQIRFLTCEQLLPTHSFLYICKRTNTWRGSKPAARLSKNTHPQTQIHTDRSSSPETICLQSSAGLPGRTLLIFTVFDTFVALNLTEFLSHVNSGGHAF